ncbi:MAG: hypothetical protein HQ580_04740 [Planctomycetes bacterium]|nr:hypothetical protein [Planctomycetota bacterium]
MSNISHRSRKTICCVFAVIFFCALGAYATVSLPAPDNAALLYYQALLFRPELDDETFIHFDRVLSGDDPNEMVREYLNLPESRQAIRITEAASKILDCSWGIDRSQGLTLLKEWRNLALFLEVDARTLAFDGEYRTALERCLSIRSFAHHIVDENILGYLISMPIDFRSLRCIHYALGSMPPDRDTLIWLQSQISVVQGAPSTPARALEISLNDDLEYLSGHPERFTEWREYISERIEDESTKQEILSLTYEEVLERAKESYERFLSSVNRVIGSDMLYPQKHSELKELEDELKNRSIVDDPFVLIWAFPRNVAEWHNIYVRGIANFNATKVAIEIYLVKAETGQLTDVLPANLPKDPFSGQDFEYNTTDEGFSISFDPENLSNLRVRQFEFIVAQ